MKVEREVEEKERRIQRKRDKNSSLRSRLSFFCTQIVQVVNNRNIYIFFLFEIHRESLINCCNTKYTRERLLCDTKGIKTAVNRRFSNTEITINPVFHTLDNRFYFIFQLNQTRCVPLCVLQHVVQKYPEIYFRTYNR